MSESLRHPEPVANFETLIANIRDGSREQFTVASLLLGEWLSGSASAKDISKKAPVVGLLAEYKAELEKRASASGDKAVIGFTENNLAELQQAVRDFATKYLLLSFERPGTSLIDILAGKKRITDIADMAGDPLPEHLSGQAIYKAAIATIKNAEREAGKAANTARLC